MLPGHFPLSELWRLRRFRSAAPLSSVTIRTTVFASTGRGKVRSDADSIISNCRS